MDTRVQKYRMTCWMGRLFVVLSLVASWGAQAAVESVAPLSGGSTWYLIQWPVNHPFASAEAACLSPMNLPPWLIGVYVYVGTAPNATYYASQGMLNCVFLDTRTGVNAVYSAAARYPGVCPIPTVNPTVPYVYNPTNGMCERPILACPDHAHGTPCACDDGYKFDAAGTSCILEQYTISLSGLGGVVMPKETRDAYALVSKNDGSAKSGAQVTLTLTVVPELAGQLPLTYTGTLSANAVSTGSTTYSEATGTDGKLPFVFTAPVAGGLHTITATCTNCTNQAMDTIKVPGCSVDDLPPITDPEVQLFEDNPDRSDETRLTDRMKEALACLKRDAAAGSPNVGSAYRPPAYNQHLIEVWKKWRRELKNNEEPACAALKTKIQGHFKTHKLKETQEPVVGSRHTVGEAVDVTISLPPATIDAFWPGCRLYRPPSLRTSDPVHFIYR